MPRLCKLVITNLERERTDDVPPLRRFHEHVRAGQPAAPLRIDEDVRARLATYEAAFQDAVGMGWREADEAWREWILSL